MMGKICICIGNKYDRRKRLEAGMNEHITKPIDIEKMTAVIVEYRKNKFIKSEKRISGVSIISIILYRSYTSEVLKSCHICV